MKRRRMADLSPGELEIALQAASRDRACTICTHAERDAIDVPRQQRLDVLKCRGARQLA